MLQKGFLKSQTKKETNTSAAKTSRMFLLLGVIVILSALIYMMTHIQQADLIIGVWLPVVIAGICLVFVGLWINFFTQNKNRRQSKY